MFRRTMPQRPSSRLATERQKKFKIRFAVNAPWAKRVFVAGSFNEWDPKTTPLEERSAGRWETTLSLPPGRYEYKFVVDGQWTHDPTALQNVPDQYGALNSVIEVKENGAGR